MKANDTGTRRKNAAGTGSESPEIPPDDRPTIAPGRSLREQIMARRAANYGLPRDKPRYILTDEEWVREELAKLRATPTPVPAPRVPQMVYFIQAEAGAIKIGIAGNIEMRMRSLQHMSPVPLRLLATCSGGLKQERHYHARFAAHRLHGEWFNPHPDILAEIERLTHAPS